MKFSKIAACVWLCAGVLATSAPSLAASSCKSVNEAFVQDSYPHAVYYTGSAARSLARAVGQRGNRVYSARFATGRYLWIFDRQCYVGRFRHAG